MATLEEGISEALQNGAEHAQVSVVEEGVIQIALRGSSFERNYNFNRVSAVRVVCEKAWGVASSTRHDLSLLVKHAVKQAKLAKSLRSRRVELAEAAMAKGSFSFKEVKPVLAYEDEAVELVADLAEAISAGVGRGSVFIEATLTGVKTTRRILTSDGANAVEYKPLVDLAVSVAIKGVKPFVVSAQIGSVGGIEALEAAMEPLTKRLVSRINSVSKATLLNPLMRGVRTSVVLDKEAACAFIHEAVAHGLEADVAIETGDRVKGLSPGCEEVTVYDTPLAGGYGSYAFDDEGVVAKRKALVERGIVVSALHTRQTAKVVGDEPTGNGRGLYAMPKAFASNLVTSPGSWRFSEMVEEMREGFVVEGLVKAELREGVIEICPEHAWYVKKGESVTPVLVSSIKIPASTALKAVRGVGRKAYERAAYEKSFTTSEKAPPILVEGAMVF